MEILGYSEIVDDSINILKDDYTELWLISARIQEFNPKYYLKEILEATKIVITELINNHDAVLVDIQTEKIMITTMEKSREILNRHLNQQKEIPNIGNGIWLTIESNSA